MHRNPQKRPKMCEYVECSIVGRLVSYYATFIEYSRKFFTPPFLYVPPPLIGV